MSDASGAIRAANLSVVASDEEAQPTTAFCSHCGARPDADANSRVCTSCGLGLILHAATGSAPEYGGAFLVVDETMSVAAVSQAAERLLATRETEAVNRHLTQLLVPADAELQGPANLAVAVTWAARGDPAARKIFVRPAYSFGVRISARVASCGPPTAALVVFD